MPRYGRIPLASWTHPSDAMGASLPWDRCTPLRDGCILPWASVHPSRGIDALTSLGHVSTSLGDTATPLGGAPFHGRRCTHPVGSIRPPTASMHRRTTSTRPPPTSTHPSRWGARLACTSMHPSRGGNPPIPQGHASSPPRQARPCRTNRWPDVDFRVRNGAAAMKESRRSPARSSGTRLSERPVTSKAIASRFHLGTIPRAEARGTGAHRFAKPASRRAPSGEQLARSPPRGGLCAPAYKVPRASARGF